MIESLVACTAKRPRICSPQPMSQFCDDNSNGKFRTAFARRCLAAARQPRRQRLLFDVHGQRAWCPWDRLPPIRQVRSGHADRRASAAVHRPRALSRAYRPRAPGRRSNRLLSPPLSDRAGPADHRPCPGTRFSRHRRPWAAIKRGHRQTARADRLTNREPPSKPACTNEQRPE